MAETLLKRAIDKNPTPSCRTLPSVRSDVRMVGEIGRYIREGGGKRIRPALLLLGCRLCGYRGDRAVLLASVVEFIHTATLLHDDIIDQATVRRGRRSVNSRWGNDVTVLLGDFLYTKSMSMALSQDNLKILRLLSDVTTSPAEAYRQAGESVSSGALRRAHTLYLKALEAEPHNSTIRISYALACAALGLWKEAANACREVLEGEPEDVVAEAA
jgi:tetratricopeptide (TPR) repeat protein